MLAGRPALFGMVSVGMAGTAMGVSVKLSKPWPPVPPTLGGSWKPTSGDAAGLRSWEACGLARTMGEDSGED